MNILKLIEEANAFCERIVAETSAEVQAMNIIEELCVAIEIDKGIRCCHCKSANVSRGDSFMYSQCRDCGKVFN